MNEILKWGADSPVLFFFFFRCTQGMAVTQTSSVTMLGPLPAVQFFFFYGSDPNLCSDNAGSLTCCPVLIF